MKRPNQIRSARRTGGPASRGDDAPSTGCCRSGSWRSGSSRAAGWCAGSLAALLAMTPAVHAQVPAPLEAQTVAFDIASQPLASALLIFGRQAGLSVLAPSPLVEGKTAPDLHARLSPDVALGRLLEGSGLSFEFVEANAVRISAKDHAAIDAVPSPVEGDDDPSRIVVTGTNIKGVQPIASPIEVYTARDVERSGATTTEQFVAKLPQNLGTMSQYAVGSSIASPNLDAVSSVDLRGLGIGTTLTLINGHRMALSNGGRSGDVSFIPASAIKRVEVLTDGASAIYGSDAVGGVINFVLRDDFEGAEARLSYGGVTRGGLHQGDASLTAGQKWAGGHGLATYDYHSASALMTSDRDYAAGAGPGNLTPQDIRHNLFAVLSQDLTDRLTLDFNAGGSWRKIKNGYSNLSSPTLASQTFARYGSTSEQGFGSLSLDYQISDDWSADVSAAYSGVDTNGTVSLVLFNRSPVVTRTQAYDTSNSQLDVTGKVDGTLFALPGGRVRVSLGGGFLDERFKGISPITSVNSAGTLSRRSTYAFGEVLAPLAAPDQHIPMIRRLSLSLAARYTNYDDTSHPALNREFGDSVDPKVGVLWSPDAALDLRATYGTSFRAPPLTDLDKSGGGHYLFPQTVAGTPSIVLGLAGYAVEDLSPETATTYTAGFDFHSKALPGFRFSATYYNIDYKDRIGVAPSGGLDEFATPDLLPDRIYRAPSADYIEQLLTDSRLLVNLSSVDVSDPHAGAADLYARPDVWIYDTRLRNLAISRQDGFDVSLSQDMSTALGDIHLGATATHILSYKQQGSPSSLVLTAVDIPGEPAEWRGRASASLSRDRFDGTINLNYTDSYRNPAAAPGYQHIGSWTTVDVSMSYALGDKARPYRLSLSIQNLFDRNPPFLGTGPGSSIIYPIGFDPANANPLGRFIMAGLSHTW
ncbi:MAG: TonB-dependent receptor [Alphaproteobacteria bacterium]|nr:TonB-dependent receptor [Alphaproteobacteria bacterium]